MAMYAPESPTTAELEAMYPLNFEAGVEITLARERVGEILDGADGIVGILGPCAMNDQAAIIAEEGAAMQEATATHSGLYVVHRKPPWKPRTKPEDWHGLETTDPEAAYATLSQGANDGVSAAIELAHMPHVERYGNMLTVGWFGGRNVGKSAMMNEVALYDPSLPLAVKNGLDGTIDDALAHVARLRELRGEDGAPVVLLYRGGENAQTPEAWEYHYREAMDATEGRMIVDVAHGTEMAHDLSGQFKKSAAGQERALEHVIDIAEDHGEVPKALMAEASRADSPTDPHMPFQIALNGVLRLHGLAMAGATSSRA
jgi:hypothetical protein